MNLNTVLLGILLALGTWTLSRVSVLSEQMAVASERHNTTTLAITDLRARVVAIEVSVQRLQIENAATTRISSTTTTTTSIPNKPIIP